MGCPELTTYDYFASVEAKPKSAHRRNANKNITELLDDTGIVRAHYEYSPDCYSIAAGSVVPLMGV